MNAVACHGMEEKAFSWLLACLGALPLASFATVALFALSQLGGQWPSDHHFGSNDGSASAVSGLWLLFMISAGAAPVYVVTLMIHLLDRRWSVSRADSLGAVAFVAGLLLWTAASDRLLIWFID